MQTYSLHTFILCVVYCTPSVQVFIFLLPPYLFRSRPAGHLIQKVDTVDMDSLLAHAEGVSVTAI